MDGLADRDFALDGASYAQGWARIGEWSPLMAPVVANLDEQDLLAIVAYLASRDPRAHREERWDCAMFSRITRRTRRRRTNWDRANVLQKQDTAWPGR